MFDIKKTLRSLESKGRKTEDLYALNFTFMPAVVVHRQPQGWVLSRTGRDEGESLRPSVGINECSEHLSSQRPIVFENQQAVDNFLTEHPHTTLGRIVHRLRTVQHQRHVLTLDEISQQLACPPMPRKVRAWSVQERASWLFRHVRDHHQGVLRAPLLRIVRIGDEELLLFGEEHLGLKQYHQLRLLHHHSNIYRLRDPKFFLAQNYRTMDVEPISQTKIRLPEETEGGSAAVDPRNPNRVLLFRRDYSGPRVLRLSHQKLPKELRTLHLIPVGDLEKPCAFNENKPWVLQPHERGVPVDIVSALSQR